MLSMEMVMKLFVDLLQLAEIIAPPFQIHTLRSTRYESVCRLKEVIELNSLQ